MKQVLAILLSIGTLTGCAAQAVYPQWPDAAPSLMQQCEPLVLVDETTEKLSEMVKTVVENNTRHHVCREKVDAWISWYSRQKIIFDNWNKTRIINQSSEPFKLD